MDIQTVLRQACTELSGERLDAEVLLAYVLKKNRSYLYMHPEQNLEADQLKFYQGLIHQRKHHQPIAYLTGEKEFWSLSLKTSISTLIPRPDTEALVDYVLTHFPSTALRVCDLGTGSGAIALALAQARPQWHILACDKQTSALALAQSNAKQHQLNQIQFIQSDWFQRLNGYHFDLIISNPPYIDARDKHLTEADVQYEPRTALVSAMDGLHDLRMLIEASPKYLTNKGQLIMEHGYQQQQAVLDIFKDHQWQQAQGFLDTSGHPRFCVGQYHAL